MKTKITFVLTLMLLTGVRLHAAPLTVAVYDFTGDPGAQSYGNAVTTLVTADLTTETNLVMLERTELNKALNEQAFGVSGMVSSDTAAKIGQITGAKVLVSGEVIKTGDNHLVIVANIIGTETGRLFADKIEGAADHLTDLTASLSRKIAQTIVDQTTNLVFAPRELNADHLARILKNISGTNRPSIGMNIIRYSKTWQEATVENEFGKVLMKAGFPVVDDQSDYKPDVKINGGGDFIAETHRDGLYSATYSLDVKIQDRRTGNILSFDHQKSTATDIGQGAARTAAQIQAVDDLAERLLPLLAK